MTTIRLPLDWDLVQLGDVARVYSGGTPSRSVAAYWGGDIPWVTTAEIDTLHVLSSRETITTYGLGSSAAKIAQPGTLLMAMYGQGKTRGKVAMLDIAAAMNQACAAIEVGDRADATFLLYFLSAQYKAIRGMSNSGSQDNLSGEIVKRIPVALPPIREQRVIAAVLDDGSAHVTGLENLIAKKRDIKQGMMQELLTGRTRLPGFSAAWRKLHLGDHVSYIKSVALSREQLDDSSPLRYLHYGDIHTRAEVRLDAAAEPMPRASAHLAGRAGHLAPGDLVFADASEDAAGVGKSVEVVAVPREGVVPGLHTIAARFDKRVLADGFKSYLQFIPTFRESLLRLAAGTKVLATTRSYISSVDVTLPDVDEQRAIAATLRDADAELAAIERRFGSACAIQTGMMEDLLTGRTRFPAEAAS